MWLVLGLWKLGMVKHKDYSAAHFAGESGFLELNGGVFKVYARGSIEVRRLVEKMAAAFQSVGITLPKYQVALDREQFTPSQCRSLQKALVQAYAYQLVASTATPVNAPGQVIFNFRLVSTGRVIEQMSIWVVNHLDIPAIQAAGGDPNTMLGVCHSFERDGESLRMNDWTWIPGDVVADFLKTPRSLTYLPPLRRSLNRIRTERRRSPRARHPNLLSTQM